MMFGVMMILMRAPSPMLVAVGMYLPIYSTFAIFVGGVLKWIVDGALVRKRYNATQIGRANNTGILLASGFVAGEALMGVVIAAFIVGFDLQPGQALVTLISSPTIQGILGLLVFPFILWLFYRFANAEARSI
jgi:hypothetical protein